MPKKKVVIIHGYTSSPKKKKYQIIAEELEKIGVEYLIPELPGGKHPRAAEWVYVMDREIRRDDSLVIIAGHSLGTRAILLWLDRFEYKVDTVILFSAFNNDVEANRKERNEDVATFFEYPVDIKKVKQCARRFIVVHSRDDDAIDYDQGVGIAKELGAELITYEEMGHITEDEIGAEKAAGVFLEIIKKNL